MIDPPVTDSPPPPASWPEVARLCRQICCLRERGQTEDAAQLSAGRLAEALASLRGTAEEGVTIEQRVGSIFAVEEERVANATLLAALLAPLLGEQLRTLAGTTAALPATPMTSAPPAGAGSVPLRHPTPKSPRAPTTEIADFIDDMLAQERAGRASGPARHS